LACIVRNAVAWLACACPNRAAFSLEPGLAANAARSMVNLTMAVASALSAVRKSAIVLAALALRAWSARSNALSSALSCFNAARSCLACLDVEAADDVKSLTAALSVRDCRRNDSSCLVMTLISCC